MKSQKQSTVAAVATPHGEGGIAVIRISGTDALSISSAVYRGAETLEHAEERRAVYGRIVHKGRFIDEVIITVFRAPRSYTGEDTVEISCHGSPYIASLVLQSLVENGAVPAGPGEFTKRAFLNGKIDLAQAEAVADLIKARTESARRVAGMQVSGYLSKYIDEMRTAIIQASALLELELDFSEQDIEFVSRDEIKQNLLDIKSKLKRLVESYNRGRVCREGIRMAITGLPNVGKSSVLNGLMERERAIVTHIPGTTRDTIEDVLDIEGIKVRITDTAGIRRSDDPVEQQGVMRAKKAVHEADVVLLVLDGSRPVSSDTVNLISWVIESAKDIVCILNKADLEQQTTQEEMATLLPDKEVWSVSAIEDQGMKTLIKVITSHALKRGLPDGQELLITRERHRDAVAKALERVDHAVLSIDRDMSQEFIALDMRGAADALGAIMGTVSPDDVLNKIFADFCIGK